MKGKMARTILGILFMTALCISVASTAQAQGRACSRARAAGTYANSMSGTVGGTPYAAVELLTADAAGNISGKQTSSWNGSIIPSTISGTYTVNANCTGTVSFTRNTETGELLGTGTLALVWDDDMQEVRFLLTSIVAPDGITNVPVIMKGEGRKLSTRSGNEQ